MSFNGHRAATTTTQVRLPAVPEPACVVCPVLHPSEPCPVLSPVPVPIAPPKLNICEPILKAMIEFIGFLALCPSGEERKDVQPKLVHYVVSLADWFVHLYKMERSKGFSCVLKVFCRIESFIMVLSQRGAWQCHQSRTEPGFAPFPMQGDLDNCSDASQRLALLLPGERSVGVPSLETPWVRKHQLLASETHSPGASPHLYILTFSH